MIINGYKVVTERPTPKMRLSEKVPVTDEFRAEINAWMIRFFGMAEPVVPKGQAIVIEINKTIMVREEDYAAICAAAR